MAGGDPRDVNGTGGTLVSGHIKDDLVVVSFWIVDDAVVFFKHGVWWFTRRGICNWCKLKLNVKFYRKTQQWKSFFRMVKGPFYTI